MLFSCQNDQTELVNNNLLAVVVHLAADPTLAIRMNQIEAFTQKKRFTGRIVNGKIEIPVNVNVLYRTAAENISLAQIQSQIDILNKDFNATNSDFNQVPALFAGVKANVGITFVLVGDIENQRLEHHGNNR
jgi:hypothetical protein